MAFFKNIFKYFLKIINFNQNVKEFKSKWMNPFKKQFCPVDRKRRLGHTHTCVTCLVTLTTYKKHFTQSTISSSTFRVWGVNTVNIVMQYFLVMLSDLSENPTAREPPWAGKHLFSEGFIRGSVLGLKKVG